VGALKRTGELPINGLAEEWIGLRNGIERSQIHTWVFAEGCATRKQATGHTP
jgi:hypothetical protein